MVRWIGQNGNFNFSGGGKVSGVLDADNTAQINISGGGGTTIMSGIVRMSMAAIPECWVGRIERRGVAYPDADF